MKRRVAVAVSAGLVFYAFGDVLLWQRIFEAYLDPLNLASGIILIQQAARDWISPEAISALISPEAHYSRSKRGGG